MTGIYDIRPGVVLRLEPDVLTVFARHRQHGRRPEAGGILLGRDFPGTRICVEAASVPSPLDRVGRTWFDRSRLGAQRAVDAAWRRSDGEQIYLGEWHTHPEDYPAPSSRDRAMIANMRRDTVMEIDFLFLVIVGRRETWVGMQDSDGLRRLDSEGAGQNI